MKTLEKLDYVRHHLGNDAELSDGVGGLKLLGKVESIDSEDGTIGFCYGLLDTEKHRFVDVEKLNWRLKNFSDLTPGIAFNIIDHSRYEGNMLDSKKFHVKTHTKDRIVMISQAYDVIIKSNWAITIIKNGSAPINDNLDNYPEIVFLLCKWGFDVTGYFC